MSRGEMRIVLVLPTFLPESYGGAEQQALRLAKCLQERSLGVVILAPRLLANTPAREFFDGRGVVRLRVGALPNLGGRHFFFFFLLVL
jgi:hypothetical protein